MENIQNILPNKIKNLNEDELDESIDSILLQWPEISMNSNDDVIKKESYLWQQKWRSAEEKPNTFIDAMNLCNELVFPNFYNSKDLCNYPSHSCFDWKKFFDTLEK